jgi:hypothetical protein
MKLQISRVGQNHKYIRCAYNIFGWEITKNTVVYGVYIRFWPILLTDIARCWRWTNAYQKLQPMYAPSLTYTLSHKQIHTGTY